MFYAWNVFGVEHVCYSRMVLHACVCRSMFGVNRGCTELPTAPAAALTMKALFLTKKSTLSAGNTLGSSMLEGASKVAQSPSFKTSSTSSSYYVCDII